MNRRAVFVRRLVLAVGLVVVGLLTATAVAFAKQSSALAPMDAPAFGAFLGPCNSTTDCASGLSCQSYKQYGLRCTKSCEADSDCSAPSKGCSKQHRCSMPTATAGHPRQ